MITMHAIFDLFDVNHSGEISEELEELLEMGLRNPKLEATPDRNAIQKNHEKQEG